MKNQINVNLNLTNILPCIFQKFIFVNFKYRRILKILFNPSNSEAIFVSARHVPQNVPDLFIVRVHSEIL